MKKIDFGDNKTFIENYKKLKSSRKMAEIYGCSKSTILKHAKKIGYDNSNNKELKITKYPVEQIYQEYLKLGSCNEVGKKYSCSGTSVRNYLIQNNYKINNKNHKLSNISPEELINKYEELESSQKVAEYYGCSKTAILNKLHDFNYTIDKKYKNKLSEEDKKKIIASYHSHTSTELAKEYDVSRGMITKIWYDNNLLGKKFDYQNTTEIDISGQTFGNWQVLYKTDERDSGGNIKWMCRCLLCGLERPVSSASLRNGISQSCGNHNISRGNDKIASILKQNNINFIQEKRFDSCKDINSLPFDFFVENSYLIEYDGEQHYKKNIGYIFDYEKIHKHDLIKSKWCKDNNIPLIRIPYTQFNKLSIEDLLLETSSFVE